MQFLHLVIFVDADKIEKMPQSAELWEERTGFSKCAALRGLGLLFRKEQCKIMLM